MPKPHGSVLRLQGIPILDAIDAVTELASALTRSLALPLKAVSDAIHIATAAVHINGIIAL